MAYAAEDVQRGEPYRGHESVEEFWRLYEEELEEISIEPEQILDGGDCVLMFATNRAKGRQSGVPVEIRDVQLWTHDEDGLATSLHMFLDRDQALEAAGLPSSAGAGGSD